MSAQLRGPLDVAVKQIVDGRTFLTPVNIKELQTVIPKEDETDFSGIPLKQVLEKQITMYNRLQSLALSSEDIGENTKIMQASKQLLDVMMKFGEKIDNQSRQIHVENAVVETFNDLGDEELKAKFMQNLQKNLAKKRSK